MFVIYWHFSFTQFHGFYLVMTKMVFNLIG